MNVPAFCCLTLLAFLLVAPTAVAAPSLRATPDEGEPGAARFVAVQPCAGDNKIRRAAHVTIGGDTSVRYRGQTEHGGRVSFVVVDGNEVTNFRFVNRCAEDRERGSLVPGVMPIGDVSFSRRGGRFRIFGRFRASGVVKGTAREQVAGCDSEKMTWR